MLVPELLLETLEELDEQDFLKFKWYLALNVLNSRVEISRCYLESSLRHITVSKMIESYGKEVAVSVAVEILRRMKHNNAAEKLKKTYTEGAAAEGQISGPLVTSSSALGLPTAQKNFDSGAIGSIVPSVVTATNGSMIISGNVGSVVNTGSSTTTLTVHHHHYFHTKQTTRGGSGC